jgi:hypothetical protein
MLCVYSLEVSLGVIVLVLLFLQLTTSPDAQSRSAYTEVQARSRDLKKMEQTLGEIAQLFNEVCTFRKHSSFFRFAFAERSDPSRWH